MVIVTYDLANSTEGYESSKTNSHVPANFADMDPAEGKVLYNIFCASCHGAKGDGEGILVQREKILGIPGYDEVRLTRDNSRLHLPCYHAWKKQHGKSCFSVDLFRALEDHFLRDATSCQPKPICVIPYPCLNYPRKSK